MLEKLLSIIYNGEQKKNLCLHAEDRVRPGKGSLLLVKEALDGVDGVGSLDAVDGELYGVLLDSLLKAGALELLGVGGLVGAHAVGHDVLCDVVAHVVEEEGVAVGRGVRDRATRAVRVCGLGHAIIDNADTNCFIKKNIISIKNRFIITTNFKKIYKKDVCMYVCVFYLFTGLLREGNVLVLLKETFLDTVLSVKTLEDAHDGEYPAGASVTLILRRGASSEGNDVGGGEGLCCGIHHSLDGLVDGHGLVCYHRVEDYDQQEAQ